MAATLKDIASETGLSIATISKYINGGNLKERNRIKIEAAIKKLNYTVNEYARALKSSKSRTIGVLIPELSNTFVTHILSSVEEVLHKNGYSLLVADCRSNEEQEVKEVQLLLSKMVDGIINMPTCQDGRHLTPALDQDIPVVLIDRAIPSLRGKVDAVLIDNEAVSYNATQHLLNMGHKNIAIVVGPENIFTSEFRLNGYKKALAEANVEINQDFIFHSDYSLQGGFYSTTEILNNKDITAMFVTNYEMTLGSIIAIKELNANIPDDISIIGFDNFDISRIISPSLTLVNQPLSDIGTHVANTILSRQNESSTSPFNLFLDASLIEGKSVSKL